MRVKCKGVFDLLPGLALTLAIAAVAMLLRRISSLSMFSPLMLAVLIGVGIGSAGPLPLRLQAGIVFAGRRLLRVAIVLLGFQLSVTQLVAVGWDGLFIVVAAVATTFTATIWLGAVLKVEQRLSGLIAAGTAVCGASAVAAMSTVNRSDEEDVVYAIGLVTVLGTILMLLLPIAAQLIGFDSREFGIWAGASIHEVAQVTGAAFQLSDAAGDFGVIVKLARVLMLAPLILGIGLLLRRKSGGTDKLSLVPMFVLGFLFAVALNSVIPVSAEVRVNLIALTSFLMSVALAALGLQTDFRKLKSKGIRPFLLGASATAFIVSISLGLILLFVANSGR